MSDAKDTGNWAYASLLAGGLLIVVGGLAGASMMGAFGGMMGFGMRDMMDGYGFSVTQGWLVGMAWWMGAVALLTGGLVLYAAWRLRKDPSDADLAGTLGIVGGALSLLSMGGWLLGAALAIVGGALALGGAGPGPAARRAEGP